MTKAPLVM